MIEVTDWARDILSRSVAAARRLNPEVIVRVVGAGAGVQAVLAEQPEDGDAPLLDGVFIAPDVEGMLDITEPHAQLILKPAGSEPNERAHD